ncbi:MAG TPA: hypothetical protein VHZ24_05410 [Pirellulales bacterium]|jgi:hypothetical protein|nr:hypothetical protein [Pirellulales bacterium]
MTFLIGTDEAGYGPNLGPLVISATVWRVRDDAGSDLYKLLRRVITAKPPPRQGSRGRRLALADSKALYSPDRGLGLLERGVLTMLAVAGSPATTWREAWQALAPEALDALESECWYVGYDQPLPVAPLADDALALGERLRQALADAGIELLDVRSRVIFPGQLNRLLDEHGTKGAALSFLTFELLCGVLRRFDGQPVSVICDKHGGRNRYQGLLQRHVDDWLVEVHGESRHESIYRWGPDGCRTEVRFRPRAEAFLPAALASMASKYLRELAMRAFNDFWCTRVPDLRPTAGYPRDARRFKTAIEPVQAALGVDDAHLWRVR